jgi:hypothetical protein
MLASGEKLELDALQALGPDALVSLVQRRALRREYI